MDDLKRHDHIQQLDKPVNLDPYYSRHDRDSNAFTSMTLVMIGIVIGMFMITGIKACDPQPNPAKTADVVTVPAR